MISAFFAGLLVWGAIRLMERERESLIDAWIAFSFVIVPAIIIWLLLVVGGLLGITAIYSLLLYPLYLLFPAVMLRVGYEFTWGRAFAYGCVVFLIAIFVEIAVYIGLQQLTA